MPTLRNLTFAVAALIATPISAVPSFAQTQGGAAVNEGRQVSLKDQLIYGLLVRTKSDRAFVDLVVAKVDAGVLPRALVDSTFIWARNRAASRRDAATVRPMIYFRPALIARAKKLKIDL